MPYPLFDRSKLKLKPLSERVHDMTLADVLPWMRLCRPLMILAWYRWLNVLPKRTGPEAR